jgi:hypothetical protein
MKRNHHISFPDLPEGQRTKLSIGPLPPVFFDELFQAILASIAGDIFEQGVYLASVRPQSGHSFPRPNEEEVELYIKHLENRCDNENVPWSSITFRQFGSNVPKDLVESHSCRHNYFAFVRDLANNFHVKASNILGASVRRGKVDHFLFKYGLAHLLKDTHVNSEMKDWLFLAQQVAFTMDELYEGEPLGEVTYYNVFCGGGSATGCEHMVQLGKKRTQRQKEEWAYSNYSPADAKKYLSVKLKYLPDACSKESCGQMFEIAKKLPQKKLNVLMWERDEGGNLLNMVNGRKFDWRDLEQWAVRQHQFFLCKH